MEPQKKSQIAKTTLRIKNSTEGITITDLKLYYRQR